VEVPEPYDPDEWCETLLEYPRDPPLYPLDPANIDEHSPSRRTHGNRSRMS
jgi:hypothetical protein